MANNKDAEFVMKVTVDDSELEKLPKSIDKVAKDASKSANKISSSLSRFSVKSSSSIGRMAKDSVQRNAAFRRGLREGVFGLKDTNHNPKYMRGKKLLSTGGATYQKDSWSYMAPADKARANYLKTHKADIASWNANRAKAPTIGDGKYKQSKSAEASARAIESAFAKNGLSERLKEIKGNQKTQADYGKLFDQAELKSAKKRNAEASTAQKEAEAKAEKDARDAAKVDAKIKKGFAKTKEKFDKQRESDEEKNSSYQQFLKDRKNQHKATLRRNKKEYIQSKKWKEGLKTREAISGRVKENMPITGQIKGVLGQLKKVNSLTEKIKRAFVSKLIRNAVNYIIKSFQQGVKNLYEYSRGIGTVFHKNLDRIASSALFIKNATAAMVAPLINIATPAIEKLMDLFANLANQVGFFIAKLTGQEQFSAAIKTVKKYGDEVKRVIFGFDELNILPGGKDDAGGMFEEWDTSGPNEVKTPLDTLIENIKNGEWDKAGSTLAEKMNGLLSDISPKIAEFGTKLGSMFGNAISFGVSFLRDFDFKKLGATIGSAINNMIDEISGAEFGEFISRKITSLFDTVSGLVSELHWDDIGTFIGDTFKGFFNGLTAWIQDVNWEDIGQKTFEEVKKFMTGLDFPNIAEAFWSFAGTALGAAVSFFTETIKGIGETFSDIFKDGIKAGFEKIGTWVNDHIIVPFMEAFKKTAPDWLLEILGVKEVQASSSDSGRAHSGGGTSINPGFVGSMVNKATSYVKSLYVDDERAMEFGGLFANGGYVDSGELFIAREAGPELVGSIGNKTAVANNNQIVAGIASANDGVINAVYAMASSIVSAIDSKDMNTYLDSMELSRGLQGANRRLNHYNSTSLVRSGV